MISKIKKIIITLGIFFISSTALANYVLVGNGGEGYESDGTLYTRDLFDYDSHKTPWFGDDRDQLLANQLQKWNPLDLSEVELDLLLRKLTDLNSAHTYLGDDLLMVLEYFHWSYTDDNLVLIEPDEIRKPIDTKKRVSIANRFMNSIVINKFHFQRLNPANKIALLLHEAIFSVTSLSYQKPGEASPSLAAARLITSILFNKTTLNAGSTGLLFRNQLRLSLNSDLFRTFNGSYIQVNLFDKTDSLHSASRQVFNLKALLEDSTDLKEMCDTFLSQRLRVSAVELTQVRKIVNSESYHNGSGYQEALRIQVSPEGFHNFRMTTNDPAVCSSVILEAIRKRFSLKRN